MTPRRRISAVVLGDAGDVHFRAAVDWLSQNAAACFNSDAAEALAASSLKPQASSLTEPALVVLLQSRPGQFTEAELTALQRRWPLARFVAIAASWCEGEPRSGYAAQSVYRIPWQSAADRLALELAPLDRNDHMATRRGLLAMAATATADERLLANSRPATALRSLVAVAARRASCAEPLIDALAAAGHSAVYWPLDRPALARGVNAVVWDTFGCEQQLQVHRRALPAVADNVPIVVVADFPRPQDVARLAELGVSRVLAKPFLVADLLHCLDGLLAELASTKPSPAAVA